MRRRVSAPPVSAPRPRTARPAVTAGPPPVSPSAIFQALAQVSATLVSIESILSRPPARFLHARNDELVMAILVAARVAGRRATDPVLSPEQAARAAHRDLLAIRRQLAEEAEP